VTAKFLSRSLSLPLRQAKSVLQGYWEQHKEEVTAVWVVSGWVSNGDGGKAAAATPAAAEAEGATVTAAAAEAERAAGEQQMVKEFRMRLVPSAHLAGNPCPLVAPHGRRREPRLCSFISSAAAVPSGPHPSITSLPPPPVPHRRVFFPPPPPCSLSAVQPPPICLETLSKRPHPSAHITAASPVPLRSPAAASPPAAAGAPGAAKKDQHGQHPKAEASHLGIRQEREGRKQPGQQEGHAKQAELVGSVNQGAAGLGESGNTDVKRLKDSGEGAAVPPPVAAAPAAATTTTAAAAAASRREDKGAKHSSAGGASGGDGVADKGKKNTLMGMWKKSKPQSEVKVEKGGEAKAVEEAPFGEMKKGDRVQGQQKDVKEEVVFGGGNGTAILDVGGAANANGGGGGDDDEEEEGVGFLRGAGGRLGRQGAKKKRRFAVEDEEEEEEGKGGREGEEEGKEEGNEKRKEEGKEVDEVRMGKEEAEAMNIGAVDEGQETAEVEKDVREGKEGDGELGGEGANGDEGREGETLVKEEAEMSQQDEEQGGKAVDERDDGQNGRCRPDELKGGGRSGIVLRCLKTDELKGGGRSGKKVQIEHEGAEGAAFGADSIRLMKKGRRGDEASGQEEVVERDEEVKGGGGGRDERRKAVVSEAGVGKQDKPEGAITSEEGKGEKGVKVKREHEAAEGGAFGADSIRLMKKGRKGCAEKDGEKKEQRRLSGALKGKKEEEEEEEGEGEASEGEEKKEKEVKEEDEMAEVECAVRLTPKGAGGMKGRSGGERRMVWKTDIDDRGREVTRQVEVDEFGNEVVAAAVDRAGEGEGKSEGDIDTDGGAMETGEHCNTPEEAVPKQCTRVVFRHITPPKSRLHFAKAAFRCAHSTMPSASHHPRGAFSAAPSSLPSAFLGNNGRVAAQALCVLLILTLCLVYTTTNATSRGPSDLIQQPGGGDAGAVGTGGGGMGEAREAEMRREKEEANLVRLNRLAGGMPGSDVRGWILSPMHMAAAHGLGGAKSCVDVHVGTIGPGKVRGNHRHHTKSESFLIWGADARIRIENPSLPAGYAEVMLDAADVAVFTGPAGRAHALENVDKQGRTLIFCEKSANAPDWPPPTGAPGAPMFPPLAAAAAATAPAGAANPAAAAAAVLEEPPENEERDEEPTGGARRAMPLLLLLPGGGASTATRPDEVEEVDDEEAEEVEEDGFFMLMRMVSPSCTPKI
ncbi:unnamed protein product, partial [Closterium sp. NIES-54]